MNNVKTVSKEFPQKLDCTRESLGRKQKLQPKAPAANWDMEKGDGEGCHRHRQRLGLSYILGRSMLKGTGGRSGRSARLTSESGT